METKRAASIYPTVDEINALPKKFRQYIHDLETRCDKSGDVQTIGILREDRDALQRRLEASKSILAKNDSERMRNWSPWKCASADATVGSKRLASFYESPVPTLKK
jgi:hypothetical protein